MLSATAFFDEEMTMTDRSSNSTLSVLAAQGVPAVNKTLQLVKLGVLAVSVAAAIPTAQNLYYSYKNGVPFNQVEHRLSQAALWEKNFDCKIDYRALSTAAAGKVEVGSCSKTGDISIKVSAAKGQTNYEWIAFDQLPKPAVESAGLMDLLISQAVAEELIKPQNDSAVRPILVAEAGAETMCQAKLKDVVVRVVKDNGKCVRETVSLFKGSVEKREDVPCDKACPLPK